MTRPRRDAGHIGHPLSRPEVMIGVTLVAILAAIIIPFLISPQDPAVATCLNNLILTSDGSVLAESTCPACRKKYTVDSSGPREVLRCPDPAGHLKFDIRFEREPNRFWQPAFTAAHDGADDFKAPGVTRIVVRMLPRGAQIMRETRAWYRWTVGLGAVIVSLFLAVVGIGSGVVVLRSRQGSGGLWIAFGVVFLVVGLYATLDAFGVTRFDVIGRSIHRETSIFGVALTRREIVEVAAIIPTPVRDGARLEAFHAPYDARRLTPLFDINPENAGIAAIINRILAK